MPIIFECPHCNAKMRAPDGSAGKQARCPTCSELVTIGGAPAPPPPPRPAPEEDEPRPRGVRERPDAPARRGRDEDEDEPRSRSRPSRDEDDDDRPSRRRDEDEGGGRSVRRRRPQEEPGFSIASLVLGCVAFVPCICGAYGLPISSICAIMAIVFGVIGQKKGGKGMALAGIICGAVVLLLDLILLILVIIGLSFLTMAGGR